METLANAQFVDMVVFEQILGIRHDVLIILLKSLGR
jgi:hypothetical protein